MLAHDVRGVPENIRRIFDGTAHLQNFSRQRVPKPVRAGARHPRSLEYRRHSAAGNCDERAPRSTAAPEQVRAVESTLV